MLSASPYKPLRAFKLKDAKPFKYTVAPAVVDAFARARNFTSQIENTVYVVRINIMSMNSYDVYKYNRHPL